MILYIEKLLEKMNEKDSSDLHLKSNTTPKIRQNKEIVSLDDEILDDGKMAKIIKIILKEDEQEKLKLLERGVDGYFISKSNIRYRINVFRHLKGTSIAFRKIGEKPCSFSELCLPSKIKNFLDLNYGLVLVTGSTGSGKSTTLSAIINHINQTQRKHIISIEDPIEFIHEDKMSIIEQRGLGEHVKDYVLALKDALREDPDIILIGEMRDKEVVDIALQAASTGHLVFSTLHSLDAKESIARIINLYENTDKNRIRFSLASILKGVISQRLVRRIDSGLIPAVEILKMTARVRKIILEDKDDEIKTAIEDGYLSQGMQTFDQALYELIKTDKISVEDALSQATSPSDLSLKVDKSGLNKNLIYSELSLKEDPDEIKNEKKEKSKKISIQIFKR